MVAQAETERTGTTLVRVKEWLALIGAVVVILGGLLGGMRLVVAPLYTEMQAMRRDIQAMDARMDRMDARMQEEFNVMHEEFKAVHEEFKAVRGEIGGVRDEVNSLRQDMNNEFKAVRSDIAVLRERMTRVETLLERDADRPSASDVPDTRP